MFMGPYKLSGDGWFCLMNYFIFFCISSFFTFRYGDEHKLAGFSATLQAIISFVENGYGIF